ncbi:glycosyltransferase [Bacteroides fragilis]|nr:glycosyltransferase [Bacteroides fragilis]MCS2880193.1 glycosyltransferase [Bacteroides fragilis]
MEKSGTLPLISIIVPVYNVEAYLHQCLQSILDQTYTNLEIIIVDDGSTDHSPAICDHFAALDARVKVIHKKNGGQSAARNIGLDTASGEYIGFVDSDDWIDNDMYETLYNLISQYGADISACTHYLEYEDGRPTVYRSKEEIMTFNHADVMKTLFEDKIIKNYVVEKLYKRDLFTGLYFPIGQVFEDISLSYKIFDRSNKTVLKYKPKYHYRIRLGSTTNSSFSPLKGIQYVQAIHEQYQFMKKRQLINDKPVMIIKKSIHLINHTIILPSSTLNNEVIDKTLEIMHQYDYLKPQDIRVSRTIKRYFIYHHFRIYKIGMTLYRKLIPKKRKV